MILAKQALNLMPQMDMIGMIAWIRERRAGEVASRLHCVGEIR